MYCIVGQRPAEMPIDMMRGSSIACEYEYIQNMFGRCRSRVQYVWHVLRTCACAGSLAGSILTCRAGDQPDGPSVRHLNVEPLIAPEYHFKRYESDLRTG